MAYKQAYKGTSAKKWVKPVIVKEPRKLHNWSQFQMDIFADIARGEGNTHVAALAGTGKTATIVEGFYHVPKGASTLMCAFNKSIQTELETRAPESVLVKTLHSLGYAACRRAFPKIGKPDNNKLEGFIKAERGDEQETYELRTNLAKTIALCKGYLAESPAEIDPIMDRHDVDVCGESREGFITSVIKIMTACKRDTSRVDFDDMVWLPNILGLNLAKHDMVMIDEAQDLNPAQINMALNSCTVNGRVISVGDKNQAIYSFRGADSSAVDNIIARCNSKLFPLSVTYRCARAIVELAKTIVPTFEAAPDAEQGSVDYIPENQLERLVRPGDFILSRVNAPLLKWCLTLLKAGVPANIQGKDLGESLLYMIKKSKCKDVDAFLSWLNDWRDVEVERLVKSRRDSSVIEDKAECMQVLCEGTRSLDDVRNNIEKLFHEGDMTQRVILSSTHKAKGLERDRVFMLSKTYKPTKGQEEANLYYVAITRAKKSLFMVS